MTSNIFTFRTGVQYIYQYLTKPCYMFSTNFRWLSFKPFWQMQILGKIYIFLLILMILFFLGRVFQKKKICLLWQFWNWVKLHATKNLLNSMNFKLMIFWLYRNIILSTSYNIVDFRYFEIWQSEKAPIIYLN